MKLINGHGLKRPYKSEQEFKKAFIVKGTERGAFGDRYFCIESEETEPGFPDVMKLTYKNTASFYEMKLADEKDYFEMQRTQPLFYKNHPGMEITVVVWSNKQNKLFFITTDEICRKVLAKNSLRLNLNDFQEDAIA